MPLPRSKLAVIHVAKAQLGLDDEAYRLLLARAAGVRSSRDLDRHGFKAVMAAFEAAGFKSDFGQVNLGNRRHHDMASANQVALVRALWDEYTDGIGDDASLGKWLQRTFKVSALRFLTARDAQRAIGVLKTMKARQAAPSERENGHAPA